MQGAGSLSELVRRLREGDEAAAVEMIGLYEHLIRRAVRMQIRDPRLRRSFDTGDFCQSVFRSFFARLALGEYDLDHPEQMQNLLITMARNKVATQARKPQVKRRDPRSVEDSGHDGGEPIASDADPGRQVAAQDLLSAFRTRFDPDERRLVDLRGQGCSWADVAAKVGGKPDAVRKQLTRALNRVARQLGLDDSGM
jgi:RNA polymerase sigma factor (sigma-70 family)